MEGSPLLEMSSANDLTVCVLPSDNLTVTLTSTKHFSFKDSACGVTTGLSDFLLLPGVYSLAFTFSSVIHFN